jgi:nitronate monooxygenase
MSTLETDFTRDVGVEVPLICGAMYPCSNPELVAAVSEAGGLGVIQPLSFAYVHGKSFAEGLKRVRDLTSKPVGFNAIVEKSVKVYEDRMRRWIDEALEADVRFFVTALGNPRWVCEAVHSAGGVVYHDVTEKKWAEKALAEGVDGLICVNRRAGGHAGEQQPKELFEDMSGLGVPLVCAGGIGSEKEYVEALKMGYSACQLGTRFIATDECAVHETYRSAIVDAEEEDIVLTHRLSGVPCSVIRTPMIDRLGTEAGPVARWLLKNRKTRHWMRTLYTLKSIRGLKRSSREGLGNKDVYQAGKSVAGIHEVLPAAQIVHSFKDALAATES